MGATDRYYGSPRQGDAGRGGVAPLLRTQSRARARYDASPAICPKVVERYRARPVFGREASTKDSAPRYGRGGQSSGVGELQANKIGDRRKNIGFCRWSLVHYRRGLERRRDR